MSSGWLHSLPGGALGWGIVEPPEMSSRRDSIEPVLNFYFLLFLNFIFSTMCFSNLRGVVLLHGGLAGRNFPRLNRPHLGRRQSWCARFSGQGALEFHSFIFNWIFTLIPHFDSRQSPGAERRCQPHSLVAIETRRADFRISEKWTFIIFRKPFF